jgi:hypothetical protein
VEVTATAAVLQTDSSAVQDEVTGRQVDLQELNGRNPLYMAQLIPGMRSGSTMGDFNFAVGGGVPFPNQPNLSGPSYNPTSSQFGEITGKTNLQRTLQLSLRFFF